MYVLFDLEWVTAEARRSRMRDHAPAGRQDRRSQLPGAGGLLPQPHPPRQADPQTDGGPRLPGEGMPLFRKIRRRGLLAGEKPESRREEKTPPETDPREGAAAAGSRRPHLGRHRPDHPRRDHSGGVLPLCAGAGNAHRHHGGHRQRHEARFSCPRRRRAGAPCPGENFGL